jgi:peptidoglycan/LPS O-acetylase OafA/YrhL
MSYSPSYRPDIDGLRAVAVSAVVAFHAFPNVVPGGYVGVDVFFVISGYLITSLIVGGLANGTFSFIEFYIRRVKRIFPALILVLANCFMLGWLLLLPGEFVTLGKHILSGAAFVTNIVQRNEAGYFDSAAEYKPLLHLWSLGIEEQFYLACPFITAVIWKYNRRFFFWGVLIVLASFAINIWWIFRAHSTDAFYLPFSRVWELALGSCLATMPPALGRFSKSCSPMLRNLVSWAGVGLIIVAVFMFDASTNFPGWRALLPTIGTVLIIWSGPAAWLNSVLLRHPAAVLIGLISYPIYLWHWPLLSFLSICDAGTPLLRVAAVVLSVVLSWMTYRFLEMPIRRAQPSVWIPLVAGAFCIAAIATAAYAAMLPPKFSSPQIAAVETAMKDWTGPFGKSFLFKGQVFYKEGEASKAVLFIGDSNMQQYHPRIHDFIVRNEDRLSAIYATYGGCIPVPGVVGRNEPCHDFMQSAYEFAKISDAHVVVIAAQWYGYFTNNLDFIGKESLASDEGRQKALAVLQSELESLNRLGKKVYLVSSIPVGPQFAPKSWIKRTIRGIKFQPTYEVERSSMSVEYEKIARDFARVAAATGATIIDPFSYFCDSRVCRLVDENGNPIYKDGYHLRSSFVRAHVDYLDGLLLNETKAAAASALQ